MADNTQSNNSALYFIVGALVVAVIGFGIWYFVGQGGPANNDSDLSISVTDDGVSVDAPEE